MAEKCEISIQQPKRCYVDTTGKYAQKIVEYVRNRLKGDAEQSQLTMDLAPFAGASNNRPVKFLCAIQVLAGGLSVYEEFRVLRGDLSMSGSPCQTYDPKNLQLYYIPDGLSGFTRG